MKSCLRPIIFGMVLLIAWIVGGFMGVPYGQAPSPGAIASAASSHVVGSAREPVPAPRLIHVVVALCDNRYQGIVPVPDRLGDGDSPAGNLYWGAAYGMKTFFRRSGDWKLQDSRPGPRPGILERVVFRHGSGKVFLVADAYRGREIRAAVEDFLLYAAGRQSETIPRPGGGRPAASGSEEHVDLAGRSDRSGLKGGSDADLLVYVGHDGLMDFTLDRYPSNKDGRPRQAIVLACLSRVYFAEPLRRAGATPLLWTTGLLAPEAYVLEAALEGWLAGEDAQSIRRRAAGAYHRYQKCGLKAARRLFDARS